MANQNESQNNAHPPVNLSADPPWIGFPNTNWGSSIGPAFSVRLDPQVNVRQDLVSPPLNERGRSSLMEMDELMQEFVEGNDELLGRPAR
jgi:hypothetical protein